VRKPHRKWLALAVFLILAGVICVTLWKTSPPEPSHGGKKLSVWLDELLALNHPAQWDPNTKQAQAVRAIGTNALPWLLYELRAEGSRLQSRINQLLARQSIIKYRFPDVNTRLRRACRGFEALGPIAEPAIPELMTLVEATPGYVPSALAAIGPPAVPALQQCLTNYYSCTSSVGRIVPIPNNTIGAVYNAISAGRLSNSHASLFLPAVKAWAQSTNKNPALYDSASDFLRTFDPASPIQK
jgi:hypothetical protein